LRINRRSFSSSNSIPQRLPTAFQLLSPELRATNLDGYSSASDEVRHVCGLGAEVDHGASFVAVGAEVTESAGRQTRVFSAGAPWPAARIVLPDQSAGLAKVVVRVIGQVLGPARVSFYVTPCLICGTEWTAAASASSTSTYCPGSPPGILPRSARSSPDDQTCQTRLAEPDLYHRYRPLLHDSHTGRGSGWLMDRQRGVYPQRSVGNKQLVRVDWCGTSSGSTNLPTWKNMSIVDGSYSGVTPVFSFGSGVLSTAGSVTAITRAPAQPTAQTTLPHRVIIGTRPSTARAM